MATRPSTHCPGPIDRRSWLKIGGLSLGALGGGRRSEHRATAGGRRVGDEERRPERRRFLRHFVLGQRRAEPSRDVRPQARRARRHSRTVPADRDQRARHRDQRAPAAARADGRQVRDLAVAASQSGRTLRRHASLSDRLSVDRREPAERRVPRHRLGRVEDARIASRRRADVRGEQQVVRRRARLPRPGVRAVHAGQRSGVGHRQPRLSAGAALPHRRESLELRPVARRRADAAQPPRLVATR